MNVALPLIILGMILAVIQIETIKNQARLLEVPAKHANHYTVGIGKE